MLILRDVDVFQALEVTLERLERQAFEANGESSASDPLPASDLKVFSPTAISLSSPFTNNYACNADSLCRPKSSIQPTNSYIFVGHISML